MAVVSSGSGQDNKSFKLATGPLKKHSVLICPTLQELNAYGVAWKEEPNYIAEDKGDGRGKGVIITIWAKTDPSNFNAEDANTLGDSPVRERIYLYNVPYTSQNGNFEFINKYGKFCYASSEETIPEFFNKDGLRKTIIGEKQLMLFIQAWADVRFDRKKNIGDECQLETIDAICNGDFTELKELEKTLKAKKFIWVEGLKDGGDDKFSPVVYSKEYYRIYSKGVYLDNVAIPFKTGLKQLFETQYKEFNKADIITYEPKIWNSSDLKSAQPTPDIEFGDAGVTDSSDLF